MVTRENASFYLKLAAAYNVLWGAFIILFPSALFDWAGLQRPFYPEIWQCVGMIVGVYGIGYWVASHDPVRHWPIVFVGLLGKLLGPIGFIQAYNEGVFNLKFGATILTNDLVWWYPFGAILYLALKENISVDSSGNQYTIDDLILPGGRSLSERSNDEQLLFVLVRHSGCTFCREALVQLKENLPRIKDKGFVPFVVHMGSGSSGDQLAEEFQLSEVEFISDPEQVFYRFFGARKGSFLELFGPRIWMRGFVDGVLKKRGVGALNGDGFQLGGVYMVSNGQVQVFHDPCDAADIEDWNKLLADETA